MSNGGFFLRWTVSLKKAKEALGLGKQTVMMYGTVDDELYNLAYDYYESAKNEGASSKDQAVLKEKASGGAAASSSAAESSKKL